MKIVKVGGSILLTLFIATACDSGSGSDSSGISNDDVGAPFTGRMVGTRVFDNTLLGVDLASGRFSALAGNGFLDSLGALRNDATVKTRRDRSIQSGMLVTIDDCLAEVDDTVCFFFLDRDGNASSNFTEDARFPGPGKVSFDGTHVAVNLTDRVGGNSTMTIYTRDGEFVSNYSQSGAMNSQGPYDWLPDGRLVYSMEGNALLGDDQPTGFIITAPYSATPQRRITLTDYYQDGVIKTIESSPDGSQLLINLEPRVGPTRPILLDLETLTITQLIDRTRDTVGDAEKVSWGPDGRWVYAVISSSELLTGDALVGGTIVFIGSFDSLYAYEVNGTVHPLVRSPDDLSASVRLIPTDNPRSPGGQVGGGEYDGKLVWIP